MSEEKKLGMENAAFDGAPETAKPPSPVSAYPMAIYTPSASTTAAYPAVGADPEDPGKASSLPQTPAKPSLRQRLVRPKERALAAKDSLSGLASQHSQKLRWGLWGVMGALFLAYLIYALWYDFEAALPLLIVTLLVAVGVAHSKLFAPHVMPRLQAAYGKRLRPSLAPALESGWLWPGLGAALCVGLLVFLLVDSREDYRRLVCLLGIGTFVGLGWLGSTAPLRVRWRPVLWGLALQFLMGLLIIRWAPGASLVKWLGDRVSRFLKFSDDGTSFVYGFLVNVPNICQFQWAPPIAFSVFPIIIFFSSIVSVLYYYGAMQWVVKRMAVVMEATLGTTAAESLNSAGNVFLGQTEAPLLIRPYMADMTASELHAVMTGGFATIAGTVFGVYVSFGACANHLLSASVMSAPAALAMAKLLLPETEVSKTQKVEDLELAKGDESNAVEAAAKGASTAVFLIANIIANLIAFLAILGLANALLGWLGSLVGLEGLTLELLLSYAFYPLAWVMGASGSHEELLRVAELMGIKTVLNEFIAYKRMGEMVAAGQLSSRAQLISTYALCGFSNTAAVGIQLGSLGAMCPSQAGTLGRVAVRALVAGSFACFLTACVAGLLASDVGQCVRPEPVANATQCIHLHKVLQLVLSTTN